MPFVRGLDLSGRCYREVVAPWLRGVPHSAARIGAGSEVLGFDTERSTDHDWGPHLQVFVPPGTRVSLPDPVVVAEAGTWFTGHLGFDPLGEITTADWLSTSTQALAEVTAGAVFADGLGVLHRIRRRLAWYPDDVWRYVLACQWQRIAQEEAFVGRCGEVGDELGSAVVAARLTRDLTRLCLLLQRVYPPYGKWLGSAFARLPVADRLTPLLHAALRAGGWRERERHLALAYELVAGLHNDSGLTERLDTSVRPFYDRPFLVLRADRFADALLATIPDPAMRSLPRTGAIDQFGDSTDLTHHRDRSRAVTRALLRGT